MDVDGRVRRAYSMSNDDPIRKPIERRGCVSARVTIANNRPLYTFIQR